MIICFILIKNNLLCVDNVRRIYILINWLGLKGSKSDSLIWVLDVFAIAFRIYPEGPLISFWIWSFIAKGLFCAYQFKASRILESNKLFAAVRRLPSFPKFLVLSWYVYQTIFLLLTLLVNHFSSKQGFDHAT